jgi:chaperonin cofactor prefoldin
LPELYITAHDWSYIRAAVKEASWREVGGLGVVQVTEEGLPVVKHLRLLKQEISSGEVDWADEAHAEYLEWLYTSGDKGGAGFNEADYGLYSFHSHGNMSVFWSGTDEDFIKKVGLTVPWMFSSVFNNKGEAKHRLDVFKGVSELCPALTDSQRIWYDSGDLHVIPEPAAVPVATRMKEIEESFDPRKKELEEQMKKLEDDLKGLEKDKEEALKEVRAELQDISKALNEAAESEMKDHWKENVSIYTSSSNWTNSNGKGKGSSPKGITPKGSSSSGGKKSQSQGGKKRSGKDDAGTDTALAEGLGELADNIYEAVWFRVYDMSLGTISIVNLKEILADKDLVPLEDIPTEMWDMLKEDEQKIIKDRGDAESTLTALGSVRRYGL